MDFALYKFLSFRARCCMLLVTTARFRDHKLAESERKYCPRTVRNYAAVLWHICCQFEFNLVDEL